MREEQVAVIRRARRGPVHCGVGRLLVGTRSRGRLRGLHHMAGEPRCCRTAGLCFVVPALFCVANCCCRGGKSQLVWSFWARQSRILASEKVSDLLPHIRGGAKDGWTLETKIKNVRRVGDPIRYCLANAKDLTLPDHKLTPGAIRHDLSKREICAYASCGSTPTGMENRGQGRASKKEIS